METRSLLFAVIGFLLGGLVVSIAATQLDNDDDSGNGGGGMSMSEMSESLTDKSGDDFDAAFISAMIEHHEGAIDMAELAESRAEHDEIKQLSQDIIRAQEGEISQMQNWQREWGYTDEDADHDMDMGSAPLRP